MGRYNGSFRYKAVQDAQLDEATGFYNPQADSSDEWIPGCECQIDKHIPAKQVIGTDGQMFSYTYDVFIPKHFKGDLSITTEMQLIGEDGSVEEFAIQGIDNMNRKYIEVWG